MRPSEFLFFEEGDPYRHSKGYDIFRRSALFYEVIVNEDGNGGFEAILPNGEAVKASHMLRAEYVFDDESARRIGQSRCRSDYIARGFWKGDKFKKVKKMSSFGEWQDHRIGFSWDEPSVEFEDCRYPNPGAVNYWRLHI